MEPIFGDAVAGDLESSLGGNKEGGDDTLTAQADQIVVGDVAEIRANAEGGDDTLTSTGGTLYGDALTITQTAAVAMTTSPQAERGWCSEMPGHSC